MTPRPLPCTEDSFHELTQAASAVIAWFDLHRPDLAGERIHRLRYALANASLPAPEAELARRGQGVPLTANILADAFDAMWNAAISVSHERQEGIAVASMLAEGFAAMGRHLRESAALVSPGDGWLESLALATTDSTAALDRVIRSHVEKALEIAKNAIYGFDEAAIISGITADDVLREMGGWGGG